MEPRIDEGEFLADGVIHKYMVSNQTGEPICYTNNPSVALDYLSACEFEPELPEHNINSNTETVSVKTGKRGNILKDAHRVINGERQDTYGSPEDSFNLIAEYWTTYLKSKGLITSALNKRDTAEMMMLFKIARMSGQKASVDNYVDLAGYTAIAADMLED